MEELEPVPQPAPSRARRLEAGERWARLADVAFGRPVTSVLKARGAEGRSTHGPRSEGQGSGRRGSGRQPGGLTCRCLRHSLQQNSSCCFRMCCSRSPKRLKGGRSGQRGHSCCSSCLGRHRASPPGHSAPPAPGSTRTPRLPPRPCRHPRSESQEGGRSDCCVRWRRGTESNQPGEAGWGHVEMGLIRAPASSKRFPC